MNAVNPLQPAPPPGGDPRSHEPSMEEILASIRRIIADDQVAPAATASGNPSPQAPAAGTSGASSLRGTLRERIPYRGEDREASTDGGERLRAFASPEREATSSGLPREVAVRPAETASAGNSLSGYGQVTAPQFPMPDGPATDLAGSDPGLFASPSRPAPPVEVSTAGSPGLPELATRDGEAERAHGAAEAARSPSREPRTETGERAAALFSTSTNQSVSSAFNMLAATRLADNSDELLAMARDMIRPLLKTWLDDNLPSLVERLVRAEIERVARGGR